MSPSSVKVFRDRKTEVADDLTSWGKTVATLVSNKCKDIVSELCLSSCYTPLQEDQEDSIRRLPRKSCLLCLGKFLFARSNHFQIE